MIIWINDKDKNDSSIGEGIYVKEQWIVLAWMKYKRFNNVSVGVYCT